MIIVIILISSCFLFGLAYCLYIFLKLYGIKSQNYLIEIDKLKDQYQNSLLLTQIEIQEQTFNNISREIHDNIGQKLSIAKMHLNILFEDQPNPTKEKLGASLQLVSQAIHDLSGITKSLSSDLILEHGLIFALNGEIQQLINLSKYVIDFKIEGEQVFLDNKKELIIFRIIQEGINNIIKHSGSNHIAISLNYTKSHLVLKIQDNGKGYHSAQSLGSGLNNMMKRTKMIGGEFESASRLNEGTILNIKIPYQYEIGKNQSIISG